jgi:metal-responsive CopG/Arc/MetJ family transcriptional regulator
MPHERIAITLPPEDLAAADRLAKAQDRSRSWIIAEAIRRYAAEMDSRDTTALDKSRRVQLQRDLTLTAEARIRASEEIATAQPRTNRQLEQPRTFRNYAEFERWRRKRSKS